MYRPTDVHTRRARRHERMRVTDMRDRAGRAELAEARRAVTR